MAWTKVAELKGKQGEIGPQGPQGIPAVTAVPTDAGVAAYMGGGVTTATKTALAVREGIIRVKDYGATGDGTTDDTAQVQAAINAANAAGGGTVSFGRGTFLVSGLTTYSNVQIVGSGRAVSVIKLKNGSNKDVILGFGSAALWGPGAGGGIFGAGVRNIEIDGNRANNTTGSGVAIYGRSNFFSDLYIHDCATNGLRTEYDDDGSSALWGMESSYDNIYIERIGQHGFQFAGPHDSMVNTMNVVDAGISATNTYSGINISGGGNARWSNIHVWTHGPSVQPIRMRHAINVGGTAGANEFVLCHFEGAYTANVLLDSPRNVMKAVRVYAPWNGINVIIRQPNDVDLVLGGPVSGLPAALGVQLGQGSDNATGCTIVLSGTAMNVGYVDFTNSLGGNTVLVNGYNVAGVAWAGDPKASDEVNIAVAGITGGYLRKVKAGGDVTALGTNQATATALGYYESYRIGSGAAATGVRLPKALGSTQVSITNLTGIILYVYPATGELINSQSVNTALGIGAGKTITFISPNAATWVANTSA